jgi:hypothetical protein
MRGDYCFKLRSHAPGFSCGNSADESRQQMRKQPRLIQHISTQARALARPSDDEHWTASETQAPMNQHAAQICRKLSQHASARYIYSARYGGGGKGFRVKTSRASSIRLRPESQIIPS